MKATLRFIRLTALLAIPAGCAAMAAAEDKAKEADVIYPRSSTTAGTPAGPAKSGGEANTAILGFALLAAATGGWLLWRRKNSPAGAAGAARRLAIAETRSLGNRQYLVVADYDGRKFLLGVCPGRIEMLTPLGEGDDDAEAS
ncbi:MAG: hypothetical protein C0502_06015 [Opitutus sp.]|nr:hypothetical protein [Opitutus sp.]